MNVLIWLLPFIVLVLGYFSNKVNFIKLVRIKLYAVILFCAFLFDLMSLSFVNIYVDSISYLIVTFILCDIGFNILRIKKVLIKTILMILGVAAFVYAYKDWVAGGPSRVVEYWIEKPLDTYVNQKQERYFLRQHTNYFTTSAGRIISLYKVKKVPVIETCVREYKVSDNYQLSEFMYGWSNTANGVRLDLINGKDTIWTLGEGF
ncbi:MAG: hypothetical protein GX639_10460 [Fibrobacter sp.]|nr:hypothetical protein [Fibrobacter sp.]